MRAAMDIFLGCDRFKMMWIHAVPDSAQVVNLETSWNGTKCSFVCQTMGQFPAIPTVSIPVSGTDPEDATRLVTFGGPFVKGALLHICLLGLDGESVQPLGGPITRKTGPRTQKCPVEAAFSGLRLSHPLRSL